MRSNYKPNNIDISNLKLSGMSKIIRADDLSAYLLGNNALLGTGSRRVHQDGIVMLDKHLSMKDSNQKIEIM